MYSISMEESLLTVPSVLSKLPDSETYAVDIGGDVTTPTSFSQRIADA
jgi:hypothetical protein